MSWQRASVRPLVPHQGRKVRGSRSYQSGMTRWCMSLYAKVAPSTLQDIPVGRQ